MHYEHLIKTRSNPKNQDYKQHYSDIFIDNLTYSYEITFRTNKRLYIIHETLFNVCGPGISVGIETDYGLDGPGSNPGEDEIFCPSRPALQPTQPTLKWVQVLSRG